MVRVRPLHRGRNVVHQNQPKNKKTSKLKDRQIEYKTSFFDSTMGKVVGIALITFMIFTSIFGISFFMMPNQSSQTSISYANPAITNQYFNGFVRTGQWHAMSNTKTTHSCKVDETLEGLKECNSNAKYIHSHLETTPEIKEAIHSRGELFDGGFAFQVNNAIVNLGVSSKIRKNYELALSFLDEEVLTPNFANKNIETTIKKTHQILVQDLKHSDEEHPSILGGKYRTDHLYIQYDDKGADHVALKKLVEKRNGVGTYPQFLEALRKVTNNGELTAKESKIFKSVAYIPPSPRDISKKMTLFASKYKEKLLSKKPPFDLAAWVHMQIVNIHAFEDGNGRLARVYMNAELKRGGYLPIVILDDIAYSKAIQEDQKNPGIFAKYLKSIYPISQQIDNLA